MGKISPKDSELLERIDEVLHYLWDPIGVRGVPAARDEYESYVGHVFTLLKSNADVEQLSKHLTQIRIVNMGLGGLDVPARENEIAAVLIEWKELLFDE